VPLLLLLNDQNIKKVIENEVIKKETQFAMQKNLKNPPLKKRKNRGPKI